MATQLFYNPRPQFPNKKGQPAALGRVSFLYPNTTTLKEVYNSKEATTPADNPSVLDASGYLNVTGGLYLGEGEYKVVLEESDNNGGYLPGWTVDPVNGADITPAGIFSSIVVGNIAALKTLPIGEYSAAYVLGYYTPGDQGGGWCIWNGTSSAVDDAGSIFSPAGAPALGRWERVFNAESINSFEWGAMESAPGVVDGRLLSMIDYATATNSISNCVLPESTYRIGGDITLTGAINLILEVGAVFETASASIIDIILSTQDVNIQGEYQVSSGNAFVDYKPTTKRDANILWWGNGDYSTWSRAESKYNGRLIVSTPVDLEVTGPAPVVLSHGPILFRNNGTMTFSEVLPDFTISSYETETLRGQLFFDNYDAIIWGDQREFKAQHFTDASLSTAEYTQLITNLSGGNKVSITWGLYPLWQINANLGPQIFLIDTIVAPESLIEFVGLAGGTCWFGNVINGPQHIFKTDTGTSEIYPLVSNTELLAQWWGVNTAPNVSNIIGLTTAVNTSIEYNSASLDPRQHPWVSLDGATVSLSSQLFIDASAAFRIREGILVKDVGYDSTKEIIRTSASVQFKEISFGIGSTTAPGTYVFNGVGSPKLVEFTDCYAENTAGSIVFSTAVSTDALVKYTNCDIVMSLITAEAISATVGNHIVSINGGSIKGGLTVDTASTALMIFTEVNVQSQAIATNRAKYASCSFRSDSPMLLTGSGFVTDCNFVDTTLKVNAAVNSTIDNNQFHTTASATDNLGGVYNLSHVILEDAATSTYSGLKITGNTFSSSNVLTAARKIVQEGLINAPSLSVSHGPCTVKENVYTGWLLGATESVETVALTVAAPGPEDKIFSPNVAWSILNAKSDVNLVYGGYGTSIRSTSADYILGPDGPGEITKPLRFYKGIASITCAIGLAGTAIATTSYDIAVLTQRNSL